MGQRRGSLNISKAAVSRRKRRYSSYVAAYYVDIFEGFRGDEMLYSRTLPRCISKHLGAERSGMVY